MKKHPGYQLILRCDPHMVHHLIQTIPVWCDRMKVDVKHKSTNKIKMEMELIFETRWDISEQALNAVHARLSDTKTVRNVRIIPPAVEPK